jgi:DNA-binding MarR family transcriptional regulator
MSAQQDNIDELAGQWAAQRPDIDWEVMPLVARLILVGELMARQVRRTATEYGVHHGEGDVVFTLRRAGPPFRLSPSQLAASLLVTSGTMTNRLDNLEKRGLIDRKPNPNDRRGMDVELTAEGRRLVDEAVVTHVAREQRMVEPLSEQERGELARLTRKLLAHLRSGGEGAGASGG